MISFEDIVKANDGLSTLDLKGKKYVMVPQRVKAFRKLFPEGFITPEIISLDNGVCVMRAEVGYFDENGNRRILGVGTAYEIQGKGLVNGTSYIENCETSCVGRALGFLALGIDGGGICSAEELVNAITAQEQMKKDQEELIRKKEESLPPFERPKQEENVTVTTSATLPQFSDDVMAYISKQKDILREAREINKVENDKIFRKQAEKLMINGICPNKDIRTYTMQEAEQLINMMYSRFDRLGTELKEVVTGDRQTA